MSNRILDYPEATAITSDDYILLDNEGTGAKCIKASALNINMDNYTIKEARGAIASFDDGEDLPLAFMGAYITALQDLHGYYYPWVGGSGKNLFNMGSKWSGSASGLSFTTDDDYVTMNGVKSGANYVTPSQLYFDLPAGTYYAKAFVISGTASNEPSIYVYSNQELTSNMLNTGRSFTLESQTSVGIRFTFWNDGATYSNYKIGIVISKDADIDKFYPYSNICPIIGWSGVNVTVADATTSPTVSNVYTLTFTDGSNPLTVYGGTVDLVSGVLTVDRVMFALNGSENWATDIVGDNKRRFTCTSLIDLGVTTTTTFDAISNIYVNTKSASYTNLSEVFILRYLSQYNQNRIDIMTETYQDVESFKAFLNSTNMQIVYELATPLTYQLTPTMIYSLIGENNIFADTGDSIVDYRKLWVKPEM